MGTATPAYGDEPGAPHARGAAVIIGVGAVAGLFLPPERYLLFHSLVELFAIVVAVGFFMIVWNARRLLARDYLLVVGIGYLATAAVDLVHTLAYRGMSVLRVEGANTATQLWIAARYVETATLLVAPAFVDRRARPLPMLAGYALVVAAVLLAVLHWDVFPVCWVEGRGLTAFKVASEYAVVAGLAAAGALLYGRRSVLDPAVARLILASIGLTMASELCLSLYVDPYGFANELGHVLKLASFYVLYKAVIESALRRPYGSLFRELKQSEEALARSNRELEGYAHTVSHDLRSPLSAMVTSAELVERLARGGPESAERLVTVAERLRRSALKAAELTDDLLALAEAGQRPTDVTEVDVGAVVARILDERASAIRERRLDVVVEGPLGTVRASPAHVYQLFSNLIGNVLRHNDSPGPCVRIARLPDRGGEHLFRVRDNGPGIPPELLDKVFLPFTKGSSGGHGIGLSTVHKIVGAYDGSIQVCNDGGARFDIALRDP